MSDDQRLPKINFAKRVIDFGDDLALFKIVTVLIMRRVDLDPADLGPVLAGYGLGANPADRIAFGDPVPARPAYPPMAAERPLSERFGLYRNRTRRPETPPAA